MWRSPSSRGVETSDVVPVALPPPHRTPGSTSPAGTHVRWNSAFSASLPGDPTQPDGAPWTLPQRPGPRTQTGRAGGQDTTRYREQSRGDTFPEGFCSGDSSSKAPRRPRPGGASLDRQGTPSFPSQGPGVATLSTARTITPSHRGASETTTLVKQKRQHPEGTWI